MTPKSLLRHPRAASTVEELATGRFYPVLDDPTMTPERRAGVRRLILCSGKVYVDLVESKPGGAGPADGDGQPDGAAFEAARAAVAIARLERLYPFPAEELRDLIAGYPALREVVWLQEEPRNMGAWCFIAPRLREVLTELAADPAEREAARLGEDGGLPARAFAGLPLRYIGRPERSSPAEGAVERFTVNQEQLVAAAYDLDPRPRAATYVSHESATDVQPAAVGVLVSD
jgi:2-oxoglutarate dehydrogenase E1 component